MSDAQRLARLVLILCWIAIAGVAGFLVRVAFTGTLPFTTHPDPETGTAGLLVETDRGTGCQYILTPWGGIVARTGADGRQLCTAAKP